MPSSIEREERSTGSGGSRHEIRALAIGLIAVFAFGLTLPFTRIAVVATSPFEVFVIRLLLACVVAAVVLRVRGVAVPARSNWRLLAWTSAGVVFGFPLFTALALETGGAGRGGVVLGILPLATAVAGTVVNGERPPPSFWPIAGIGALLVILFTSRDTADAPPTLSGDILLFAATVSAAVGYATGARLAREMPAGDVIGWAIVIATPVAVLLLPFVDVASLRPGTLGERFWATLFALGYLGLVSQYGGFLLWYRALATGGVARTAQLQLLQPFFTLAGAAVIAGEAIRADAIVFAILIVTTVLAARRIAAR